jgi:hypothetical protein
MHPRTDRYNNVSQWRQEIDAYTLWTDGNVETKKTYEPYDVLHIFRNRKSGFVFGTPDYVPVFDDIRALRKLEDHVDMLVHKFTFPLFHVRVGTEGAPAGRNLDGNMEVDEVRDEFQRLADEGSFVTNERVELKVIGAENKALDVSPYLEHLKKRVQIGSYLSDVDIGSGDLANRATARQLSLGFQERCKEFQRVIEQFLTHGLFDLLLMEGGYTLTPENTVEFQFNEIDLENRMAINNHAMALYQGHAITRTEARTMMNMPPVEKTQEKDMFWELVEKPATLMKAVDEPYTKAAKKATTNKNQPTNQTGAKVAKTQPKNDLLIHEVKGLIGKAAFREFDRDELQERVSVLILSSMETQLDTGMKRMCPDLFVGANIRKGFGRVLAPHLTTIFDRFVEDLGRAKNGVDKSIAAEMCSEDLERYIDALDAHAHGYGVLRGYILLKGGDALGVPLKDVSLYDIADLVTKISDF